MNRNKAKKRYEEKKKKVKEKKKNGEEKKKKIKDEFTTLRINDQL